MTIELTGVCTLLQVFDMPRSLKFYCDALGFRIANQSPAYASEQGVELFHWARLERDGLELMLNTAYDEGQRPAEPEPARIAAHEDTQLYFACSDVDDAYAALTTLGLPCDPPSTSGYGMRQLALRDPDGYGVTLQQPTH